MNVQTIRDITKDSIVQPFKAKKYMYLKIL